MHFNAIFTSLALAVTFAFSANADTIQAFSGTACDGSVGNTVQCDGSCHLFSGRHSLRISGGGTHCVSYFVNNNCDFQESQGGAEVFGSNQCHHVNTGGPVGSFICASNTICQA